MHLKGFLAAIFAVSVTCAPSYVLAETITLNSSLSLQYTPRVEGDALVSDFDDGVIPVLISETHLDYSDSWERIRSGFKMDTLDDPLVARHEQWYTSRPEYMARMTERAHRYLFYIIEEVERRDMPTEIALLPIIESAFNPSAYSVGRAAGIWQFIPSTAKIFGMERNWWSDERRDIISATRGALDYLQKLHNQFNDWQLALAAYNWGEGAVARAMEHNRRNGKPTNYSSLKMPDETRNYVPKLLAIKNIINNPTQFGVTLHPIPNRPYFATVTTGSHIDVKLAAKLADISEEEFMALNPSHNRPVILQEEGDVLLLPINKIETFRTNLENHSEPLVTWQAYQTKKGERLDQLAPRFGLSVAKLRSINGLSQNAKLTNGQTLLVPAMGDSTDPFEAFNTDLVPNEPLPSRTIAYTVRKGDTLSGIAKRHGVSVARLKSWNNGVSNLRPGQKLAIIKNSSRSSTQKNSKTANKKSVTSHSGKSKVAATQSRSSTSSNKEAPKSVKLSYQSSQHKNNKTSPD